MTVLGVLLALVVGATLGMFGGGGAVLTVPIFVYVLGVAPKSAIPMSFVVIGIASAFGAAMRWRQNSLDVTRGFGLGTAAVLGAFAGARIGAGIPARVQLLLFGTAVLAAAISFFRAPAAAEAARPRTPGALGIVTFALIGAFTAIVGVGGGFLFVPALVAILGVPMLEATGLSLVVIAMNASAALVGYAGRVTIDWRVALTFTAVAMVAMIPAAAIARRLPDIVLKRAFGVVLLVIGALVLFDNLR